MRPWAKKLDDFYQDGVEQATIFKGEDRERKTERHRKSMSVVISV